MTNHIYAGFWRRLIAGVIDAYLISIPISVISGIAISVMAWNANNFSTIEQYLTRLFVINLLTLVFYFIVGVLYFGGMQSRKSGATIGKRIMKIKVVDSTGEVITFRKSLLRYISMFLSSILGIGFIMIAFTKHKQGLHDLFSKSYVVKTNTNI
ncbi:RDD family protein [Metabacillus niabensis]|uniref:RDD family protein n=1 Tax=Metabacillus niabensis TaxID=324854 RepID=UPI00399F07FF